MEAFVIMREAKKLFSTDKVPPVTVKPVVALSSMQLATNWLRDMRHIYDHETLMYVTDFTDNSLTVRLLLTIIRYYVVAVDYI